MEKGKKMCVYCDYPISGIVKEAFLWDSELEESVMGYYHPYCYEEVEDLQAEMILKREKDQVLRDGGGVD